MLGIACSGGCITPCPKGAKLCSFPSLLTQDFPASCKILPEISRNTSGHFFWNMNWFICYRDFRVDTLIRKVTEWEKEHKIAYGNFIMAIEDGGSKALLSSVPTRGWGNHPWSESEFHLVNRCCIAGSHRLSESQCHQLCLSSIKKSQHPIQRIRQRHMVHCCCVCFFCLSWNRHNINKTNITLDL